MYAGNRLREVIKFLLSLLAGIAGWLLIAPLAVLTPRRRDWIAVIGRQRGSFLDNSKYFFLRARGIAPELRIVFVTERREVWTLLNGARASLRFPTFGAIWFLMRCGTVVVDEAAWFRKLRFFFLIRSRAIQLWHGVGCKWIEAGLWRHEIGRTGWASRGIAIRTRLLVYRITGRRMRYAAVATTSHFYRDEVFAPAFDALHFPITGYPRNDFALSLEGENRKLAWANVDAGIKGRLFEWRQLGRKLVLVAPTFRDSGTMPMQLDATTLHVVDAFAEANGIEFIFKFHPAERNADHVAGRHFHLCARDSDIYPVMPYLAALVTDYSSISMDFLLVDKPLLFLIPDGDDYARKERNLQFDPRTMMPGPVVTCWSSLLPSLLAEWAHDQHVRERATLRSRAFDDLPQSEAVPKLIAMMRGLGWLPEALGT
jgi:hypothetical protein